MLIVKTHQRIVFIGAGQHLAVESSQTGQWQLTVHPGRQVLFVGSQKVVRGVFEGIHHAILENWDDATHIYVDIEAVARMAQ